MTAAEVLRAILDGAKPEEFEISSLGGDAWATFLPSVWRLNNLLNTTANFRRKPKPDGVGYVNIYPKGWHPSLEAARHAGGGCTVGVVKLTYDGETDQLKSVEIVK